MARPSKLTEKQWAEIGKRLLGGEKPAALAKEFKIDRAALTRRFSQQVKTVNHVAKQIVTAEASLYALPVAQQLEAISLANKLRSISTHLASAAEYGSMTAHRLSGIAHGQVEKIDDADPLCEQSLESLKGIAALTKMANASSEIGLNLLRANKEAIDSINRDGDKPEPKQIVFSVVDASA